MESEIEKHQYGDCVSFIDCYGDSEPGMRNLLEEAHNEWLDIEAKALSLWKLIVVNGVHVLFIFYHSVCDGIGGTEFHWSVLAALNKFAKDDVISTSCGFTVNTPDTPILRVYGCNTDFSRAEAFTPMLQILLLYVWLLVLRFCFRERIGYSVTLSTPWQFRTWLVHAATRNVL
jgi:hypothetical protein